MQNDSKSSLIKFPASRTRAVSSDKSVRDLGLTPLSRQLGSSGRHPKGHWCSQCKGIWYSYFPEAECHICGNRHG